MYRNCFHQYSWWKQTLWMHAPTIFYLKQTTFFFGVEEGKSSPKIPQDRFMDVSYFYLLSRPFELFFQQAISQFLIKSVEGGWGGSHLHKVIFILDENQKKGLCRIRKREPEVSYCCRTLHFSSQLKEAPNRNMQFWNNWNMQQSTSRKKKIKSRTRIQKSLQNDIRVKEPPECKVKSWGVSGMPSV